MGVVAGSTGRSVVLGRRGGSVDGQVGAGSARSRSSPARSSQAQGADAARWSRRVRPWSARRPAMENSRRRRRFGSHRRAGWPARASICHQAVRSTASATTASQIRFWSKSCSGRLGRCRLHTVRWPRAGRDLRHLGRTSSSIEIQARAINGRQGSWTLHRNLRHGGVNQLAALLMTILLIGAILTITAWVISDEQRTRRLALLLTTS